MGLDVKDALAVKELHLENASIITDVTTGLVIGTATAQKIGFYGVTPIARAILATGAAATVDNVITALQNLGLLRQS